MNQPAADAFTNNGAVVTKWWCDSAFPSSAHKYWYDILMGFKTELMVAYIVTLVFILLLVIIRNVTEENSQQHAIDSMETEIEKYEAETKRLNHMPRLSAKAASKP